MKKNRKNNLTLIFINIVCLFLVSGSHPILTSHTQTSPNIVLLLADDLRWDALGFSGNPIIKTPAIDSLARQGTVFSQAYVTTSICSASRASILSGQYGRRHEKWGFGPGFGPDQWEQTYPAQLNNAGYRTGFIGKYGVGELNYARDQFDYWKGFGGQGSFNAVDENNNPIHLTRLIGQQAQEFFNTNPPNQPFCLSISFKAPHVEGGSDNWQLFDPEYATEYESAYFPQALSGEPQYFDHFSSAFMGSNNEARLRYFIRFGNPDLAQNSIEGYYRLIHGIDRAISEMVATLQQNGQLDNTIIIFSSDNGMYLGEYGFSGKWYGSEISSRVPLFIYDARMPLQQRRTELALNIDIAPTILDYADATIPATVQGQSLVPLVSNNSTPNWRTEFLYEHLWPSTSIRIPSVEGVIKDTIKYMRYFENFNFNSIIEEELYFHKSDSFEINNLSGQSAYENLRTELSLELDSLIQQAR